MATFFLCGPGKPRFVPLDLECLSFNNAQHPLRDWRFFMKYAIIGSGEIGTALAHTFAGNNIEVAIANSRGPETPCWRDSQT